MSARPRSTTSAYSPAWYSALSGAQSSQPNGTKAWPGLPPRAMIVVPASSAKAVRFTPGRANTSVPAGCVDALAVQLERCVPSQHEVELLVRIGLGLVVLVDEPVAGGAGGPRVHAERGDPEVMAHRPVRAAPVVQLLDLVELRNLVRHSGSPTRA